MSFSESQNEKPNHTKGFMKTRTLNQFAMLLGVLVLVHENPIGAQTAPAHSGPVAVPRAPQGPAAGGNTVAPNNSTPTAPPVNSPNTPAPINPNLTPPGLGPVTNNNNLNVERERVFIRTNGAGFTNTNGFFFRAPGGGNRMGPPNTPAPVKPSPTSPGLGPVMNNNSLSVERERVFIRTNGAGFTDTNGFFFRAPGGGSGTSLNTGNNTPPSGNYPPVN